MYLRVFAGSRFVCFDGKLPLKSGKRSLSRAMDTLPPDTVIIYYKHITETGTSEALDVLAPMNRPLIYPDESLTCYIPIPWLFVLILFTNTPPHPYHPFRQ